MIELLKRYKIFLLSQVVVLVLFFVHPEMAKLACVNSLKFLWEIILILPPILVLIGLVDAWVPAKTVETYLGKSSGVKGMLASVLVGSVAAGPLFAAFPIAATFARKGGRIANTVIFLGAWGTIKIPMLLMESHFIGLRFSLLRLALTLPFIFAIGLLVELFMREASDKSVGKPHRESSDV